MAEFRRSCALCGIEACVYCDADSAFLCEVCDQKVHCANFLVARHVRVRVCPQCHTHAEKMNSSCSCSLETEEENGDGDDDCSSSCVSSTTGEEADVTSSSSPRSSRRRKRDDVRIFNVLDVKAEAILRNWSRIFNMYDNIVVMTAVELLYESRMTTLPLRVSLASAFWKAMKLRAPETATCHELRRLEKITGVPAKMIVATEPSTARVNRRRQSREDHVEGWAEC